MHDLPVGFKFSCDHPDNLHFGLQSRNNRDWNQMTWNIELVNIECKNDLVKLWSAGKDFKTSPKDQVVVWIRKDRRVEYYNNGILETSGDVIDESKFPIDFVISPPDNNNSGFLRNIGYVSDPETGNCVQGTIVINSFFKYTFFKFKKENITFYISNIDFTACDCSDSKCANDPLPLPGARLVSNL